MKITVLNTVIRMMITILNLMIIVKIIMMAAIAMTMLPRTFNLILEGLHAVITINHINIQNGHGNNIKTQKYCVGNVASTFGLFKTLLKKILTIVLEVKRNIRTLFKFIRHLYLRI